MSGDSTFLKTHKKKKSPQHQRKVTTTYDFMETVVFAKELIIFKLEMCTSEGCFYDKYNNKH